MNNVKVRVLRPLWHRGASHPSGAEVDANLVEAEMLLASGRADLVDPKNRVLVDRAHRESVDHALRIARRRVVNEPVASAPWMRTWPR